MKRRKIIKAIILFFLLAAGTAGFFLFPDTLPGVPADNAAGEPLIRLVIVGEVSRDGFALNRYLRQAPVITADNGTSVLAHYGNAMPTEAEKERLRAAGITLATLPLLAADDLPYFLHEEADSDSYPALRRELSVLYLCGRENDLILLQFTLDTSPEELAHVLAEAGDPALLAVKFSPGEYGEWDDRQFNHLARLAIDCGAGLVVGHHRQGLKPPEIYRDTLIVPGLGFFLGDRRADDGAFAVLSVYEEGWRAEIHPLKLTDGVPAPPKPWHYLAAHKTLRKLGAGGFARDGLILRHESAAIAAKMDPGRENLFPAGAVYGVAAANPLAVEAGMAVLRAGGNAVDAAAAVSYALAVVEPQGSGLGGGGIMLIHLASENRQVVVDYRETAPQVKTDPRIIMNWPSTGIPGFVRGLEKAVAHFGAMEYRQVIEPAYKLARDGFPVSPELSRRIGNNTAKLLRGADARRDFFERGRPLAPGRILKQPALADTLQAIMAGGSDAFYRGETAQAIIATLAAEGLELSASNLAGYNPVIREPLAVDYRGYTVVTVPPPAGGFNLLQQLRILESYDLSQQGPEVYYLLERVLAATYSDRRAYVGDPNFVQVPVHELLGDDYLREKLTQIESGNVPPRHYADPHRPSDNTTAAVVVDADGNWVSVTNTISYFFGYGLQAGGFFLNTQLNNFSSNPQSPNRYQQGKRPFSHISPTLVFKDGKPVLALGTPGGRRIPAFLTQVIVRHVDFGEPIGQAVAAPRFWSENKKFYVERGITRETTALFRSKGYEIVTGNPEWYFGRMSALHLDPETGILSGTGDPRRGEGTVQTGK
jgi:gamma-glutamyltranspeptidase/glutathione hydrolase